MSGPLASLKVLDFSTLLPGPFASLMLADMGAEVLRIESPTRMDLLRVLPPLDQGTSASHAYLNRNKRSLALDLKQAEALEIVRALVKEYDIVLEQFRPGVMERLGLGYEALKAINPRLIYVSITGYGQTGPYKDRAGHDINYLALAGVASYTGRQGSGPLPLGVQLADVGGGSLHAVVGLLAAVVARQHSGVGQYLDVSMTDCSFSLNAMAGAGYLACGVEPEWENHVLNGGSFYDYYRSRDGRWLSVGSLEPGFMQSLCTALGRPELAAQGLSPNPDQQKALKQALQVEFEKRSFDELCALFAEVDACVEPVLSLSEAVEHPQLKARELVSQVPRGDGSTQAQLACPLKFSDGLPAPRHIGVAVGAHTDEVLVALGFSSQHIADLRKAKIVG
ncbi:Acetyl-CoA:oxalate CoA-transferase [Pseudomonas fluorescens]|jgi:crotonobetainyl-CoA:carnitine CoA-transferase CaiB-like acyl-CoA transferase|uniref:CaiB/BaiF CoA transferase family protein n=1 Tax=Pseudomonas lurida TaxID=244566 RepID=UPI000BF685F4|nr:CaiB/BaiF CoA-transferase family protein [Pseudomonas lurida]VVN15865.1 Acetyl-CoA:oxalate CoA-transferase [Pseudomonas fluorescens]MBC3246487.1 CoA transferase [Pseudomonas lurida]PFG24612.1 crotonobetainyl-CoA:carnitine CoA-transferase CaiB-like acyl-CoA transferase [Pseudomonas lurida]WLG26470.1 CaiB/BaiF CoA-transferase family protein [Pseudomonas lurida]VVP63150.1 Acetyl-CoA:oxalate CoA-transferase [Pseudomonas fluorescens]